MLNIDSNGWSIIPTDPTSKYVYVSSSTGSDTNVGDIQNPVKTLAKGFSMLRKGPTGDRLYLKKGDSWTNSNIDWKSSGAASGSPSGIFAYGSGHRPVIYSDSSAVSNFTSVNNVAYIGIAIMGLNRNPDLPGFSPAAKAGSGVEIMHVSQNILIEDCHIGYFASGNITVITGQVNVFHNNLTFRRNLIVGAWGDGSFQGQGVYAEAIDGLLIEGNIFDHNGWTGGIASMFRHNMYLQHGTLKNVIVRDNIISRGSSFGCQLRSSGVIENNFFYDNAIHASVSGDNGVFRGNVCVGGHNLTIPYTQPLKGGVALNSLNSIAENNLFVDKDDTVTKYPIQALSLGTRAWTPAGPRTFSLINNTVYNWAGYPVGFGEPYAQGVISNNRFQRVNGTMMAAYGVCPDLTVSNNVYDPKTPPPVLNYGKNTPKGSGSHIETIKFPNPNCWMADDFITRINNQSKDTWDDSVTASHMISLFRSAFSLETPTLPTSSVINLSVFNAITGDAIANPIEGPLDIDLSQTPQICFVANVGKGTAGVKYNYEGNLHTEKNAPLSYPGDAGQGHWVGFSPTVGNHNITAIPFDSNDIDGPIFTLTFTVKSITPAPPSVIKIAATYNDGTEDVMVIDKPVTQISAIQIILPK